MAFFYSLAFADAPAINPADQSIADSLATLINMFSGLILAQPWSAKVVGILGAALVLIGSSSVIVQLLEKLAGITANTKDDALVGYIKRGLGFLHYLLSRIALNPKK